MSLILRGHLNLNLKVVWKFKIVGKIKCSFKFFISIQVFKLICTLRYESFSYVIKENFENEQIIYLITAFNHVSKE